MKPALFVRETNLTAMWKMNWSQESNSLFSLHCGLAHHQGWVLDPEKQHRDLVSAPGTCCPNIPQATPPTTPDLIPLPWTRPCGMGTRWSAGGAKGPVIELSPTGQFLPAQCGEGHLTMALHHSQPCALTQMGGQKRKRGHISLLQIWGKGWGTHTHIHMFLRLSAWPGELFTTKLTNFPIKFWLVHLCVSNRTND